MNFSILAAWTPAGIAGTMPAMLGGAWPALLAAGAGTIPPPPAGTFEPWMLNLCMALAIVVLLLTVVLLGKQLFGRQPAIHVELETVSKKHAELEKKLLEKIEGCLTVKSFNDYREERAKDIEALKRGIDGVEAAVRANASANYRGRKGIHKQINAHGEALAFIAGASGRQQGAKIRSLVQKGRPETDESDSTEESEG